MKGSNPLNDIAANLGVTPKVLTQLATGEDREFRELVRGILSMLPEPEILMVASDPEIPPEFLEYLRRLFDNNRKILFAILQNPAGQRQTKRAILEKLPENTLMALLQNPATPADIREILTQARSPKSQGGPMPNAPSQAEEFKIKMKVSKLLNDLEANLGVSIEAFMAIRGRDDEQSKEFVREVYHALPEENVLIVARDATTTTKILDYLSQLFDTNQKVLYTILHNPIANEKTKRFILSRLSENAVMMAAKNPKTPPDLLAFLAYNFEKSDELLALLLMNPSTPTAVKEKIEEQSSSEESGGTDDTLDLEEFPSDFTPQASAPSNDVEAKITLCVDKLYDINADIVTEFIKQARIEILKRLELIARANRLILRTIMRTPSLSIQDIEHINMDMFVTLLKKLPDDVDEKTILQLMMQSKTSK